MIRKILMSLMCVGMVFSVTACGENTNTNDGTSNNETNEEKVTLASEYTMLEIFGADVKFKLANPTYLWDSQDNFGAGEIDTVFIPSKDGKEVGNYYDIENTSGVIFMTSDDVIDSESNIKNNYKSWYNLDVTIEDLNNQLFERHIKGEDSKVYFESYCFQYEGVYDGEDIGTIYYSIQLVLYKEDYTQEQINKIKAEYHAIIDTFEFDK